MDAANVDLKGFIERFYHQVCGSHLQPRLETLIYLKHHTRVWFEITNLLIPGENDSERESEGMTQLPPDKAKHSKKVMGNYLSISPSIVRHAVTPRAAVQH